MGRKITQNSFFHPAEREMYALPVDHRFSARSWERQRNPYRHGSNLLQFWRLKLVKRLAPSLITVATASVAVTVLNCGYMAELIPMLQAVWPDAASSVSLDAFRLDSPLTIPTEPYLLTSGLLTVGLVFRTNQSLERYNSGRDAWTLTLRHTRTMMRMSSNWMTGSPFPLNPPEQPPEPITEELPDESQLAMRQNGDGGQSSVESWRRGSTDLDQLTRLLMVYPWTLRAHINMRSLTQWQARADQQGVLQMVPQAEGFLDERQLRRLTAYLNEWHQSTEAWSTGPQSQLVNLPLAIQHQIGFLLAQRFQRDDLHIVQLLQLDGDVYCMNSYCMNSHCMNSYCMNSYCMNSYCMNSYCII